MRNEKSQLLTTTTLVSTKMTKSRRRIEKDEYSSISSSSVSQVTDITTTISSAENIGEYVIRSPTRSNLSKKERDDDAEKNENDGLLVIDIEEAIDRLGMGMFQFQVVVACGLCFASDAMEVLLLSFLTLILQSQWSLTESQSDSIVSVVFLGAMMGTFVLAPLGDKLGRRIIFAVTAATISIFGVLTAFCNKYPQILAVRFMVGFGVGGLTVPYDALGELMPNSRRGSKMLSTSYFWTAGSLLVPLFAWLTLGSNNNKDNGDSDVSSEEGSWRAFVILCSLPSVVSTALGIYFVPESPRWLLTRGEHEKSLEILRRAAAKNGKDPFLTFPENVRLVDHNTGAKKTLVDAGFSKPVTVNDESHGVGDGIHRAGTVHEIRQQNKKLNTDENCHQFSSAKSNLRWCVMCSNPLWRKLSFLLGGQWFCYVFMYYGCIIAVSIVFSNIQNNEDGDNDGKSLTFDYGAIFIASSAETVGLTLAIFLVDRIGRVQTQIWAYTLGGICLLLLGILDFYVGEDVMDVGDQERRFIKRLCLLVFAFLSRMFIMGASSVTWLHTAELLPTRFRATGHGLANAMGRVGGITCPFIVSRNTSLRVIGIVMFSVGVATSVIVKHLPETSGKALGSIEVPIREEITGRPRLQVSPE